MMKEKFKEALGMILGLYVGCVVVNAINNILGKNEKGETKKSDFETEVIK